MEDVSIAVRKRRPPRGKPRTSPGPKLPGRLLAVDLGSRLIGWASADLDADGNVTRRTSGCVNLEDLGGPRRWARVDMFARWLTLQLDNGVTWLAVEEPHTGRDNVGTRHLMHGLFAFAQVISNRRLGHDARAVSRMDVFQATLGWCLRPVDPDAPKPARGRRKMRCPTKSEIRAAINARHGTSIASEDEADAVAMLDMLLAEIAGSGPIVVELPKLRPRQPDLLIQAMARENAIAVQRPMPPARAQLERELTKLGGMPAALFAKGERPVRGRRRAKG